MLDNSVKKKVFLFGILFSMVFSVSYVFASEIIGVIDATNKYAWGENIGWINFGCDNCNVQVADNAISGYAWNQNYGWINLAPTNSGVKNDGNGNLSGWAWGKNLGWIDFAGVTISPNGEFSGYATIKSNNSRINFNCNNGASCSSADFKVKTDWLPASLRSTQGNGHGGRGGSNGGSPIISPPVTTTPVVAVVNNVSNILNDVYNSIIGLFKPEKSATVIVQVPKIAPTALGKLWNILPVEAINTFVFAPLPYEIRTLASKFPELSNTLKSVGVERFTDISKLSGVTFKVPGLAQELNNTINNIGAENLAKIDNINGVGINFPGLSNPNQIPGNVSLGTGNIALIPGLPVSDFSLVQKKNLPTEFVFARADNELVDLNVALSLNDKGGVTQKIESLPGNILKLVVKPIGPARSVTGYFAFEAATPKVSENTNSISRSSLAASAIFSMNDLVVKASSAIPPEQKMVLSSFEYTDPTHSGIYTANVMAPSAPGSYQIITLIDYVDPSLGVRQIAMTAVIDPEGYVYEKSGNKETRIPSAIVSLYYLNLTTKKYELWPAKKYQQENPQVTDTSGTYSFLVPEGSYYFDVEAPGYNSYIGKVFVATEGGGIHENIELSSNSGFFADLDWRTVLLIVVSLLLMYNLWRERLLTLLLKNYGNSK